MKREISSKQTFFLKIILPASLAAIALAALLMLFFGTARENLPLLVFPLIFFALALPAMFLTVMRYKKVLIDDAFLYVSNYRREIAIPVSEIENVTETKWIRTRPVTIHLKNDSEFGRKIVFTPKLDAFRVFADNPLVGELKSLALKSGEK